MHREVERYIIRAWSSGRQYSLSGFESLIS
jgi:hypothetical protein